MNRAQLVGRPTTELRRRLDAVKRELQLAEPVPFLRRIVVGEHDEAIEAAVYRARVSGRRQRVERVHGGYQVSEVGA